MNDEIVIRINNTDYTGWKSVRVERSMDSICGAFEAMVTQKTAFNAADWKFKAGDPVKVLVNGTAILDGYLDDFEPSYDAASHEVRIVGRDKTADLVDCSNVQDASEWQNLTTATLIRKLCSPFGVSVSIETIATSDANKVEEWFVADEGSTVFDVINKACQKRGILPTCYGSGDLIITKVGAVRAPTRIESGVNVLKGRLAQSNRERYSDYFAKGQSLGFDTKQTKDFLHPKGDAKDSLIDRYRPLSILSDGAIDFGGCATRAKWEAARRAGDSRVWAYQLQGWTMTDCTPWQINSLVQVKDDSFGTNETLLLFAIGFNYDIATGTTVELHLCKQGKYSAAVELGKISTSFDLGGLFG